MSTIERLRQASTNVADANAAERGELGELGYLLNGVSRRSGDAVQVRSPFDQRPVALVHRAGREAVEAAIAGAERAFAETRNMPSWRRAAILEAVSAAITARRDEFARTIALEAGKPIRTARLEAERAAFVFKVAAEESKRLYGELVSLDWLPGAEGRSAQVRRVPLGPVAGITPFNFPLNLVAHKVAPAMAAGDPIIIRPASQTPASALKLGEIILEAGWPAEAIAVLPSSTTDAAPLIEDERIRLISFTGSPAVGWDLKRRAGRKRVTLELGGNAGVIVHRDADLSYAAERVAWGGFSYAGQSCISAQRIYVQREVYERFRDELLARVRAFAVGDPLDETTDVGPLIDLGAAERIDGWVDEAIAGGAELLIGGERDGTLYQPTVLAGVDESMRVACMEAFAPLVVLFSYDDVNAAIEAVSRSEFGLQAGLFTDSQRVIEQAFERIEVGGLMINDVSTFRIDHMPYGGVKLSGFGREGLRYAIEEMTELKLLTFNRR